jgi:prepilin-type processing-associated H-X9-DG protein
MGISSNPQGSPGSPQWGGVWGSLSCHALLLPYLEQNPIYNACNFSWGPFVAVNEATVTNRVIASFLCPSDPQAKGGAWNIAHTNSYYASYGSTTSSLSSWNGNGDTGNFWNVVLPAASTGMFTYGQSYGLRDATDGSSNTVAFFEKLSGKNGQNYMKGSAPGDGYRGNMLITGSDAPANSRILNVATNPDVVRAAVAACRTQFQNVRTGGTGNIHDYPGWRWAMGMSGVTMGNTVQPPNDSFGGCRYDTRPDVWPDDGYTYGASSPHPGGVNVTMGDGSVRFVKDSVNLVTWWALGTRDGGEAISADQF